MKKDYGVFGDVLAAAMIGSWKIEIDDGREPRMYGDATMMRLLGLDEEAKISPEAMYHAWYDHVDRAHYDAVAEGVKAMAMGNQAEIQYPWHHPDGRVITVRCGGVRDMEYKPGVRVAGIHQYVTYMKHVDRELEKQQRQLQEALAASKKSNQLLDSANKHEKLRADALNFVQQNEDLETFVGFLSERILSLYACDQVIYRDIEGHQIVKDKPGTPQLDFSICKDCPHFHFDAPVYADGLSVVDDSKVGFKGIPLHPKCLVKASLTQLVYEDGKVFGYIALHFLGAPHHFTENEKETFDRLAKILSLMLSRRKRRNAIEETLAFTNYFVGTFVSTYSVNLDTHSYKAFKRTPALEKKYPVVPDFFQSLQAYINTDVHPDDRAVLTNFTRPDNLKNLLIDHLMVSHMYRDISGGKECIHRLRVIRGVDESNAAFAFADVTDEVKKERERQKQIQDAIATEKANKAKSFFFSTVSHDIRTPLNAIIGYAELLKLGIASEEERKKAIDSVLVSGHALLELINDVLDLSKLEAGKMEILPEPVDVSRLVKEVANAFRATIGGKPVEIREDVAMMPWLKLDPHRVRQILFNLVGNAVKFTDKGSVSIRTWYEEGKNNRGTFHFEVRDTGCGISEADQERIVQPYVQVGGEDKRVKGTGLGLAICNQLVAKMGGEIVLESVLGKGTVFEVVLPNVEEANDARRALLSATQRIRLAVADPSASYHHVLVVDDVAMNRRVLRTMLGKFGISNVETADNGLKALEMMRGAKDPFDLVLADMWMPVMDGEGLVREIRKNAVWAKLPVYAVTADVEAQKNCAKMGFTGLLLKPLTFEKLKEFFHTQE